MNDSPDLSAVEPMFGDRVFVLSLILHTSVDHFRDAEWTIESSLGGPTYAAVTIRGHTYRLTIEGPT